MGEKDRGKITAMTSSTCEVGESTTVAFEDGTIWTIFNGFGTGIGEWHRLPEVPGFDE